MATVTYQNYFRLYDKLAGMTGTALTEATEFMKIYELSVVAGPDEPADGPQATATTRSTRPRRASGRRSSRRSPSATREGQPVLVGTISVEVSELLGERLKQRGIKHTVLNAKPEHAEREGETVAEAGRPGAVTIATNMAGRGVDIKLGGSPEHLDRGTSCAKLGLQPGDPDYEEHEARVLPELEARCEEDREKVMEAGGLCIIGTERHESRRIDNQLRGRAGRQGDPGESRFFLSAEDDLVRLFAGERIYRILDRFGTTDDQGREEPIEAGPADEADREGAEEGRGAELPDPQARARLRRRHERAAPRSSTPTATRCSRAATWASRRARRSRACSAASSTSSPPATTPRTGTSRACSRASPRYSRSASGSKTSTPRARTARN